MAKRYFFQKRHIVTIALSVTFLLCSGYLFANEQDAYELVPYRIITLKNIAPEAGKKFLDDMGIGTVSHFPNSSALLVTAQPRELAKAKAILDGRATPEINDVRAMAGPVLRHRIVPSFTAEAEGISAIQIVERLVADMPS